MGINRGNIFLPKRDQAMPRAMPPPQPMTVWREMSRGESSSYTCFAITDSDIPVNR